MGIDPKDDSRKNLPGERDSNYYSLHYFLRLASQGQTVAIDMLFAPENCVFLGEQGWIWKKIVANRHKLLSKNMNAFVGYARGQAAKYSLKGSRLSKLQQFCDILTDFSVRSNGLGRLEEIWAVLPKDDTRMNPQGIYELQISGKWFGQTSNVDLVLHAVENQLEAYGKRARAASEAGGVDWKALSHAVRVSKELIELLTFGQITFPLIDRDLILQIKKGEMDLTKVQEILDRDLAFIEMLIPQSRLPDTIDNKWLDEFLLEIVDNSLTIAQSAV